MSTIALPRRFALERPQLAAIALARREGTRMLRHPMFLAGALLSLGVFGLLTFRLAPVLHRDDTNIAGALWPLAAGTLIAANLAASRSARHGTDELYEGLASSTRTRIAAHLLSLLWAAGASVLLVGVMVGYLLWNSPVGTLSSAELAAGPVLVAVFGAIGIFLAVWTPHPVTGPIAIVVLLAFQLLGFQTILGINPSHSRLPWLTPWVPLSLTHGVPPELVIRPTGWHVLYLLGGLGLFSTLALGARRISLRPAVAIALSLILIGIGAAKQLQPPSHAQRVALAALLLHPRRFQICKERSTVKYCAYPAYVPWIDRWAQPIEGVLARVPPESRPEHLVVRQSFGAYFEGSTDVPGPALRRAAHAQRKLAQLASMTVGFIWHFGVDNASLEEVGPALYVASRSVGLPMNAAKITLTHHDAIKLRQTWLHTLSHRNRKKFGRKLRVGYQWGYCTTRGQARAVVAMWLAAQATPELRAWVTALHSEVPYPPRLDRAKRVYIYQGPNSPMWFQDPSHGSLDRIEFSDSDFSYAASLLNRPFSEVWPVMRTHWNVLTDPRTSTSTLVSLLHLKPLPTHEQLRAALPEGYKGAGYVFTLPRIFRSGRIPCP